MRPVHYSSAKQMMQTTKLCVNSHGSASQATSAIVLTFAKVSNLRDGSMTGHSKNDRPEVV